MREKTGKAIRRCLSLLLATAMSVTVQGMPALAETAGQRAVNANTAGGREIPSNPVHHCTKEDDGTDTTDWSYVWFGSYPQTEVTGDALTTAIMGASYDSNGDAWVDGIKYRRASKSDTNNTGYFGSSEYRYFKWERIKWKVLQNNGSTLFVAADKGLDCKNYNEKYTSVTWENCTLRNWMNNDFYSTAFSGGEQGAIVEQTVVNKDNPEYGTKGGNDTRDKVFSLSIDEVLSPDYGFCEDYGSVSRRVKASDYAHAMGAYISTSASYRGNSQWWLRSPGSSTFHAACVSYSGHVDPHGTDVFNGICACVPALHINLSSDLWTLAEDDVPDGQVGSFSLDPSLSGAPDKDLALTGSLTLSSQAQASASLLQSEIDRITWTSSNASVAEVTKVASQKSADNRSASLSVTVKPYKDGKTTITGRTSNGITRSCEVTVLNGAVSEFAIEASKTGGVKKELIVTGTIRLSEKVAASAAFLQSEIDKITWTSSDESIAKVTELTNQKSADNRSASLSVKIQAYNAGIVTITGKTSNGLTKSCIITIFGSGIQCAPACAAEEGDTAWVIVQAYGSTKEELQQIADSVTWQSADTSTATVSGGKFILPMSPDTIQSEDGTQTYTVWRGTGTLSVTGVSEGKTTITGKAAGCTDVTCQVTVTEKTEEDNEGGSFGSLELGKDTPTLSVDDKVEGMFPADWTFKHMAFPVEASVKEDKEKQTYKLRATVGIGKSDYLDSDEKWSKYKKNMDNYKKSMDQLANSDKYTGYFFGKQVSGFETKGAKVRPKVSVAGYLEGTLDKNGNVVSMKGMVVPSGKWELGGMSKQFVTPIGPVYLNLSGSAKLSGELGCSLDYKNKKLSPTGSLKLTPSVSLEGGYGIDKVAAIGANGKASFPCSLLPKQKVEFEASASLHVQVVFFLDFEKELASTGKIQLFPRSKGSVDSTGFSLADGHLSEMDTSFAAYSSEWNGVASDSQEGIEATGAKADTSASETVLMDGILPSSLPMQAETGGRQVLVFQSYDGTRATMDSSVLVYSVCENGVWSSPRPVWDNGCSDMFADMKVVNGRLALVWQKAKAKAAGDLEQNQDAVLEGIARNSEICFAVFDEASGTFTNQTYVTDNSEYDMMPRICDNTKEITLAWVRNDAADLMQESGTNTIYTASWDGSSFGKEETLARPLGTVDDFIVYGGDAGLHVLYAGQLDTGAEKVRAVFNRENQAVESLTELVQAASSGTISGMHYENGNVSFLSNGTLYRYHTSDGTAKACLAGESGFGGTARYCSNGKKSGYVWSVYDEETGTGSIVASMAAEDGYCEPVTLYEAKDVMYRYIAPVLGDDGSWKWIANAQKASEEKINHNSLVYIEKETGQQIGLAGASINPYDIVNGLTGVDYYLTNTGDTPVEALEIVLTMADGEQIKQEEQVHILPGETTLGTAYVDLSGVSQTQQISIAVYARGQANTADCIVTDTVGQPDIAVVGTASESGGKVVVTADLSNSGLSDAETTLRLYSDETQAKELCAPQAKTIKAGENAQIQMEADRADIVYNENKAAYLALKADVAGGDCNPDNNVTYVVLYAPDNGQENPGNQNLDGGEQNPGSGVQTPGQGTGNGEGTANQSRISITAVSKKIAAGKKVPLRIAVSKKGEPVPKVAWKSSNPKYASVNSEGVVATKKAGKGKTVTITATANDGSGRKATIRIKLMKHAVTKVQIKKKLNSLKAGKSATLKASVTANGKNANKAVRWVSSNPKYATVTAKGKVKAKKAGKGKVVTITAVSTDGTNKKAKIKIKIR